MMIDVALLEASIACQKQDVVKFSVMDVYDQKTDINFAKSATRAGKYTPLALAFPMFVYLIIILSTINTPLLLSIGQSAQI